MIKIANNAHTTLTASIDGSATSLSITDGSNFPDIDNTKTNDYYYITVQDANDDTLYEIMKVINKSGNTLTVERGVEGTSPRPANVDDIVDIRATAQTLQDISEKHSKRIYIDEIFFGIKGRAQFDSSTLKNYNKKFAPQLIENWDTFWYDKVKCQIIDNTQNIIYDDVTFDTIDDMITWINNNVPVDGGGRSTSVVTCKVYEVIDETIPQMTRAFGLNRFFSSIIDGQNTKTVSYASSSIGIPKLTDIFNATCGTSIDSSDMQRTGCWIPNTKKNKYGLGPGIYYRVIHSSTTDRTVYDTSSKQFESADHDTFIIKNRKMIRLSEDGTQMYADDFNVLVKKVLSDRKDKRNYSYIVTMKMISETDANKVSCVIKPFGIDNIIMEIPDFSKYTLEAVFLNDQRQSYMYIKSFSTVDDMANSTNYDVNGNKVRVAVDHLLPSSGTHYDVGLTNIYKYDKIYFRLRDRTTGKVGNLSPFYVYFENNKNRRDNGAAYIRTR